MSDLISRSAVIELLRKNMTNDIQDQIITENNINLICAIPTAYDISKVVEELEENKQWYETHGCNVDLNVGVISATNHAIDVVRKGGVE